MGILTSGYIRDRIGESHETKNGIITNKKISYCLRIPKTKDICDLLNVDYNNKNFYKFFRYENYLLTRIKNELFFSWFFQHPCILFNINNIAIRISTTYYNSVWVIVMYNCNCSIRSIS